MTLPLIVSSAIFLGILCTCLLLLSLKKLADLRIPSLSAIRCSINERISQTGNSLLDHPGSPHTKKALWCLAALSGLTGLVFTGRLIFALLCAGIFFAAVRSYSLNRKKRQDELFNSQLIEMLTAIATSVRAGQSLLQALETVSQGTRHPLDLYFKEALSQIRFGMPVNEALQEMAQRTGSREMNIVVTALTLAKETGGSMGEILTRIAETMREREKLKGKIKALTAQGKASGVVMSIVPFLLLGLMYAMEPEMVGLFFTTVLGNILLAITVIMIGLGSAVIKRLTYIDI